VALAEAVTDVGWRWSDGNLGGEEVSASEREFVAPGERPRSEVVAAYGDRAARTDEVVEVGAMVWTVCRREQG
jgi:hypothetical protein